MYLKRLEIQGFKSFAQRTVLDFLPPKDGRFSITAVVGPNGAGKSNVTDAIRWVMGEQAMKNVRAKKNEDVIFNGSEFKGALSAAEVTMVLDNDKELTGLEQHEIVITRRLYRTGESEYLLNHNEARLLDIHILLARARFAQHAYSIVGQGMIDRLLTVSPSERKDFFDEASGIKEQQIKEHQARLKLARAEENIKQAQTLLAEVEPRLRMLERQVKKLQKRQEVETELVGAQEAYYTILSSRFNTERSAYEKELTSIDATYRDAFAALEKVQNELSTLARAASRNDAFEELRGAYEKAVSSVHAIDRDLAILDGQMHVQKQVVQSQPERNFRMLSGLAAVDAVLEAQNNFGGAVFGTVAELGEVAEETRLALEVAAASQLSSVVVENEQVAKNAIEFLRSRRLGVATFLPINKIQARREDGDIERLKNEPGVVGRAIDLVTYDKKFHNIFSLALGGTLIIQDLSVAERIGFGRARFVTLAGDVVEPRGIMRGGFRSRGLLRFNALGANKKTSRENEQDVTRALEEERAAEVERLHEKRRALESSRSEKGAAAEELRQKMAAFNTGEEEKKQRVFKLQEEMQHSQQLVNGIMAERNRVQIEIARIATKQEDLGSEVMHELKMSLTALAERGIQTTEDPTTLSARIEKLKYQLSLIGGIDQEVVNEYATTRERHDFLSTQLADLSKASEDLTAMIAELGELMKKKRAVAFKQIRKEFSRYFAILFNGGKADLEEVYGEVSEDAEPAPESQEGALPVVADVIEQTPKKKEKVLTGIEVIASPPGKKVKYLSMLSGGERTLTSIALICAILHTNPSPFVVLDEVEAALDEANTTRFATIMSELCTQSQFIVVTHNRVTMHAADALYGVVMGPDGISKLLSVKLEDAAKYHQE